MAELGSDTERPEERLKLPVAEDSVLATLEVRYEHREFVPLAALERVTAERDGLAEALKVAAKLLPPEHPEKGGDPKWLAADKTLIRSALASLDGRVERERT